MAAFAGWTALTGVAGGEELRDLDEVMRTVGVDVCLDVVDAPRGRWESHEAYLRRIRVRMAREGLIAAGEVDAPSVAAQDWAVALSVQTAETCRNMARPHVSLDELLTPQGPDVPPLPEIKDDVAADIAADRAPVAAPSVHGRRRVRPEHKVLARPPARPKHASKPRMAPKDKAGACWWIFCQSGIKAF